MTVLDKLKETLEGIDIRFDEPLKSYAYTRVGKGRLFGFSTKSL